MSLSDSLAMPSQLRAFGEDSILGSGELPAFHPSVIAMPSSVLDRVVSLWSSVTSRDDSARLYYTERIKEIKDILREDGLCINSNSERDFWSFVGLIPDLRQGDLAASDEGILRAIWSGTNDDQIGLDFFGGSRVLYVFFRDTGQVKMDRDAGWSSCKNVASLIDRFHLSHLLRQ